METYFPQNIGKLNEEESYLIVRYELFMNIMNTFLNNNNNRRNWIQKIGHTYHHELWHIWNTWRYFRHIQQQKYGNKILNKRQQPEYFAQQQKRKHSTLIIQSHLKYYSLFMYRMEVARRCRFLIGNRQKIIRTFGVYQTFKLTQIHTAEVMDTWADMHKS